MDPPDLPPQNNHHLNNFPPERPLRQHHSNQQHLISDSESTHHPHRHVTEDRNNNNHSNNNNNHQNNHENNEDEINSTSTAALEAPTAGSRSIGSIGKHDDPSAPPPPAPAAAHDDPNDLDDGNNDAFLHQGLDHVQSESGGPREIDAAASLEQPPSGIRQQETSGTSDSSFHHAGDAPPPPPPAAAAAATDGVAFSGPEEQPLPAVPPFNASVAAPPPVTTPSLHPLPHQLHPSFGSPPPPPPPLLPLPPPVPLQSHPALAMAQYYESQMRDHATAYANAAAGAAWAAAQIAMAAAELAASQPQSTPPTHNYPAHHHGGGSLPTPLVGHHPINHFHHHSNGPAPPMFPFSPPPGPMASNVHPTWNAAEQHQLPFLPPQPPPYDEAPQVGPPYPPQEGGPPAVYSEDHPHPNPGLDGPRRGPGQPRLWKPRSNQLDHRRKKRHFPPHQHQPPPQNSAQSVAAAGTFPGSVPLDVVVQQQQQQAPGPHHHPARRRLRSDNDSSSSGGNSSLWLPSHNRRHHNHQQYQNQPPQSTASSSRDRRFGQPGGRGGGSGGGGGGGSSSGGGGHSANTGNGSARRHHKKPRSDVSSLLRGKTAVSVLFEWCSWRKLVPPVLEFSEVQDEFECVVLVDQAEVGRGRRRTKTAAKQEAARRAVQTLAPGAVFDGPTGLLVDLPGEDGDEGLLDDRRSEAAAAAASLEELAPNLEKLLAIGQAEDDHVEEDLHDRDATSHDGSEPSEGKRRAKYQSKRAMNVYPTTTTSEEEDENQYYASRGASVCSALLHAMVQIDPRIRDPPAFEYAVSPFPTASNPTVPPQPAKGQMTTPVVRGIFTCTATLRLYDGSDNKPSATTAPGEDSKRPAATQILTATVVAGNKKESRHMAAAQLLALLFPDCRTMVEVKAAAEAAREQYVRPQKARKQLSHPAKTRSVRQRRMPRLEESESGIAAWTAAIHPDDPPLPCSVAQDIESLTGRRRNSLDSVEDDDEETPTSLKNRQGSALRQLSRQRQLDAQVEQALHVLNEQDEEGRILPGELTEDDVGRTILRRALPDDLSRIKKLLLTEPSHTSPWMRTSGTDETSAALPFLASQLWSSSSIVLLFCRAIGAYEDPPLGCALLTLGFSMDCGRLLIVSALASEPHLPKERFLECLGQFAAAMKCHLQTTPGPGVESEQLLTEFDLRAIVAAHVNPFKDPPRTEPGVAYGAAVDESLQHVSLPLQSVLEESEVSEASSVDKRPTKRSSKPSKRSRFA